MVFAYRKILIVAERWHEIGREMTMTWQNICVIILIWETGTSYWKCTWKPSFLVYTTADARDICPSCVLSCIPSAVITHYIGQKSSIIAFNLEILFSNGILSIILCFLGFMLRFILNIKVSSFSIDIWDQFVYTDRASKYSVWVPAEAVTAPQEDR